METDLFGAYVRTRLDEWGEVFAYHRDRELLGHRSKDMLQVLIEHKGEMPPRCVGFKPLEVSNTAMQIEDVVRDIFHQDKQLAWALRAYFCGAGRRGVERYEFFKALTGRSISRKTYFEYVDTGCREVRVRLINIAQAA
jgi:hypothetical protein